jgi:hypothetical protein
MKSNLMNRENTKKKKEGEGEGKIQLYREREKTWGNYAGSEFVNGNKNKIK